MGTEIVIELAASVSKRHIDTFNWILAYKYFHRDSPTLGEIAKAIGVRSENSVRRHLDALQAAGLIIRPKSMGGGKSSKIEILKTPFFEKQ